MTVLIFAIIAFLSWKYRKIVMVPTIFVVAAYIKWKLEPYYWWLRFKVKAPVPHVVLHPDQFEE